MTLKFLTVFGLGAGSLESARGTAPPPPTAAATLTRGRLQFSSHDKHGRGTNIVASLAAAVLRPSFQTPTFPAFFVLLVINYGLNGLMDPGHINEMHA